MTTHRITESTINLKEDEILSISEAAKRLGGLSVWTLRAWLSQGKLQGLKIGRRRVISLSELSGFVNSQQSLAASEPHIRAGETACMAAV